MFAQVTKLEGDELGVTQILDVSEAFLSKKFSGVAKKLVSITSYMCVV